VDCKSVMAPIKVDLFADELAGNVLDFMVEKHMGLVPVAERDGTFCGLISGEGLMEHLLPRTLTTVSHGFMGASFLNETATEMQERLEALRQRPVGEMVDRNVMVAHPETPLIDALMMIKDKQYVVPVVDDDNKLIGAISFFSVLYGLKEEYDRETAADAKAAERQARERDKDQAKAGGQ